MSEYVKVEKGDFENLIVLLGEISAASSTVWWQEESVDYLEKLDTSIKNLKVEYVGE